MLFNVFLVGVGGCLGSIARYLMFIWVNRCLPDAIFPYGTVLVNILGCLIIGFLGGLAINKAFLAEHARIFLFTGILGGFTTFSAFSLETFYLIRVAQWGMAFFNVASQVIIGISATGFGYWVASALIKA